MIPGNSTRAVNFSMAGNRLSLIFQNEQRKGHYYMRGYWRMLSLALLPVFFATAVVSADQVILVNGDRVSGEIMAISGGRVRMITDYAGEILIDFSQVEDMEIEREGRISLVNGDVLTGRIVSVSGENIAITSQVFQEITVPRSLLLGFNEPAAGADTEELEQTRRLLQEKETELGKTQDKLAETEKKVDDLTSISKVWSGSLSLGTQLKRGNTDSSDVRFDATALRKVPREELALRFYADYGETDGETDTNEIFGEVKLKVFQTERFYLFGLTSMEYDEMENLDLRAQVFSGPGYIFIDRERTNLLGEIGAGLMGEFFDEADGDDGETLEASLRLNAEWRQKLFGNAEFFQGLTIYPSLGNFGDYRLRSETTLSTPLSKQWAIKLSLVDDYDSDPEGEDVKNNDLKCISSIQYKY